MNKQDLIRKFNYVQFDLTRAKNIALSKDTSVSGGAKLGALRKYVSLFKEYTDVRRQAVATLGFKETSKLDKLVPIEKAKVFGALNHYENKAFRQE